MKSKLVIIILSIVLMMSFSSCTNTDETDSDDMNNTKSEEGTDDSGYNKEESPEVSPGSSDENIDPSADDMQNIWDEQQKSDALDDLSEEALLQMYEDAFQDEPIGFPY